MLDETYQNQIAHSFIQAVQTMAECIEDSQTAPHVLMRPKVFLDGDKWCALYGDNLQDGVAGFGESPSEAMTDFDKNWSIKLPKNKRSQHKAR